MTKLVGVATPNFRCAQRPDSVHGTTHVAQQLYLITEDEGTVKERAYHVWLDIEHPMFDAVETDREEKQRKAVEAAGMTIRRT